MQLNILYISGGHKSVPKIIVSIVITIFLTELSLSHLFGANYNKKSLQ